MSVVPAGDSWLGSSPSDWRRSRIRNASVLSPGYSGAAPVPTEYCTVVPMEMVSEWGEIGTTEQQPFDEVSGGLTLFETGDVLFAKITPCMENGKGAYVRELPTRYGFGSTEFHVLRPRAGVDGSFLYYYAFNPVFRAYAAENMVGAAGQKRVSSRFLKNTRLFLPSFAEQQRIAAYLDASCTAIDAAVAAKRKQIETLDALRAATLQRVITRGLMPEGPLVETRNAWLERIPAGWSLVQLKRLAQVHGGLTLGKSYEGLEVVEYPYLRVANVQDGHLDLTDVTSLEVPPAVAEGVMLRPGDVLMTEGGDLDKLGRGTVWEGQLAPCLHQNHVFAVRCFPHKLLPHLLAYVTASRYGRDYFEATGKRTTNLAATNATKVGAFYIPLPPLAEQKRLVQYLDTEIGRLKAIQEIIGKQIDTLTAYRKSLIHECVTGQRRISAEDLAGVGARLPEAEACA